MILFFEKSEDFLEHLRPVFISSRNQSTYMLLKSFTGSHMMGKLPLNGSRLHHKINKSRRISGTFIFDKKFEDSMPQANSQLYKYQWQKNPVNIYNFFIRQIQ